MDLLVSGRAATMVLLGALGGSAVGCGDSCGDTSCNAGGYLYVELDDPLPTEGTVEVCFEQACGEAEMYDGGGHPDNGEIPFTSLGNWSDNREGEVLVRVRDADGMVLAEAESAPEKRGSCCGDYWTARA